MLEKLLHVYPTNVYWYKYMFSTTLVIIDIYQKISEYAYILGGHSLKCICYDHLTLQMKELKPREVKWLADLSRSHSRWHSWSRMPASWFLLHWSFVYFQILRGLNFCISSQSLSRCLPWWVRNKIWFLCSLLFLKLVKLAPVLGLLHEVSSPAGCSSSSVLFGWHPSIISVSTWMPLF